MLHTKDNDFNEIIDTTRLGNVPSEEYLRRLDILDSVVKECMQLSRQYAGIPAPTGRHFYASVLFTMMLTRAISLLFLAPHSKWTKKIIEHWDYGSMTGIARTMLEIRIAYFYLCVEDCVQDEWECRWNVFNLHDCASRRRLFEATGNPEQIAGLSEQFEGLRSRLENNPFFISLPPGRQKSILNGKTAYLSPLEDLAERAGVEKMTFRTLYVWFSAHVHGLPMSFYRMRSDEDDRGRGLPSRIEDSYSTMCLSFAASLVVRSRDEFRTMFRDIAESTPSHIAADIDGDIKAACVLSDTVPIGVPSQVGTYQDVRIEVTRISLAELKVVYFSSVTNDQVLERRLREDFGSKLVSFDRAFWTITVNGQSATEHSIADIEIKPVAFQVEHKTRTLSFKT